MLWQWVKIVKYNIRMKKIKALNFIIIILILFFNQTLKAQDIDTNQSISKKRKQYSIIINKKVKNIKIDTIDVSYYPTRTSIRPFGYKALK